MFLTIFVSTKIAPLLAGARFVLHYAEIKMSDSIVISKSPNHPKKYTETPVCHPILRQG